VTDEQVEALAEVPILVVVGDYMGSNPASACEKEMEQIKVAGVLPRARLLSGGVKACRIFAGSKIVPMCAAILSALTGPSMRVRVSACYRGRSFHALFYRF